MSGGGGLMMMPTGHSASAPNSLESLQRRRLYGRYNMPEEDDETVSTSAYGPDSASHPGDNSIQLQQATITDRSPLSGRHGRELTLPQHRPSYVSYQPPRSWTAAYGQPTPFPSHAHGSWLHPSSASSRSGYPDDLPSSRAAGGCPSVCRSQSPPSSRGSSLEQPLSLCSASPLANLRHHTLPPYFCSPQGAACCALRPSDAFAGGPVAHGPLWPLQHPVHGLCCDGRLPGAGYAQVSRHKSPANGTPLSLEQRKVFVTYEADSDKHVSEIINLVALLRHNGFDTHIDIFEQHIRSISKIDFMERYLSEKDYLIIIIISPKYYETVTASPVGLESDERTFNTVYIHKQLQNEFIQNGSKNFRFIPIVFPGARRCHVPNWLQNTHVYAWPRDCDDILRRLMRVEKYYPPPIGPLPTIVSIPI